MRISRLSSLGNKGDTIVEVLLAVAIVSAVLGGAFVSANRSLRGAQVSQERGEALKLLEGQVELLKAAQGNEAAAPGIFAATGEFCLDTSLVMRTGAPCSQGTNSRYQLGINRSGSTFTASARWTKIGTSDQEQIQITYRAYP